MSLMMPLYLYDTWYRFLHYLLFFFIYFLLLNCDIKIAYLHFCNKADSDIERVVSERNAFHLSGSHKQMQT